MPAGVSTFDEVMHRLEEELRLSGFVVVSAAVSGPSASATSAAAASEEAAAASSSSSSSSSSPVSPPGSGRAATLTVLRLEPSLALLSRRPGLAPLLPSVVCVFEAGGTDGDVIVSAAAPAALAALLPEGKRGRQQRRPEGGGEEGEGEAAAALRAADGALRSALESVFRLPKAASPPGTYAWPPVRLPAVGGSAAVAGGKARSQARREEEAARAR